MFIHDKNLNSSKQAKSSEVASASDLKNYSVSSPFICFFEVGMEQGLFKTLGDIDQLKKDNIDFSTYIDEWISYAIFNNIIKIETDGVIKYIPEAHSFFKFNDVGKKRSLEPIANTITKLAIEQNLENKLPLAGCNYFSISDHPMAVSEYKIILQDFMSKMLKLSQKKFDSTSDKVYFASLSTCTLKKEIYREI